MDENLFERLLHEDEGVHLDFKEGQYSFARATDDQRSGLGIIHIEEQPRPVFLRRDFGPLKKNEVYVRRGSSTDPQRPASADEIDRMRRSSGSPTAEITVEFAELGLDRSLGMSLSCNTRYLHMPESEEIPDYRVRGRGPVSTGSEPTNWNYYRERAKYEFEWKLHSPVRLLVKNVGRVQANDVTVELTVDREQGDNEIIEPDDMPSRPRRGLLVPRASMFRRNPAPGDVKVDMDEQRILVEVNCGTLQAGRRLLSRAFCVARLEDGTMTLTAKVYADTLPRPIPFELSIVFSVIQRTLIIDDILALPDLPD